MTRQLIDGLLAIILPTLMFMAASLHDSLRLRVGKCLRLNEVKEILQIKKL